MTKRVQSVHSSNDVIAERILSRCDTGADVLVKVFKPVPDPERTEIDEDTWVCGYEITGLDTTILAQAHGVDSMQALMLCSEGIRHHLNEAGVPVTFLSGTPGDTGFSRFHSDVRMDALFEHLIEAEVIRQNDLFALLDPSLDREPATQLLLEHVTKAEELRQEILRRLIERATKRERE